MRKYILGALIGLFGLIGISNATYYSSKIGTELNSVGSYNKIVVKKQGQVRTYNSSTDKNVFAPVSQVLFFWDENQNPYFISPSYNFQYCNSQGNYLYFHICDEIPDSGFGGTINNCQRRPYDQEQVKEFLQSTTKNDNRAYELINGGTNVQYAFNICFSSKTLGQSLCFMYKTDIYNSWCFQGNDGLGYYQIFTGNKQYTYNFSDIPGYITGTPPGYDNTQIDQYQCYTVQQLLKQYGEEYTEGLCQSSSIILSGTQIITVTPKTIQELYPTFQDLRADINLYNNYCKAPATQQTCQIAFSGKTEEYTLISKIPDNVNLLKLYNYCELKQLDPNATTCTYNTGTTQGGITINDIIEEIGGEDLTIVIPNQPPQGSGSIESGDNQRGSVFDKYLNGQQNEDNTRWDAIKNATKIIEQMKELYAKFGAIFRGRYGKNGIIPPLITGLLCLIVLYKLFKR